MRQYTSAMTLNPYIIRANEIQTDDIFGYKIVARIWNDNWCAYRGLTDWDDDMVASQCDPISEQIAFLLFPTLFESGRSYYND